MPISKLNGRIQTSDIVLGKKQRLLKNWPAQNTIQLALVFLGYNLYSSRNKEEQKVLIASTSPLLEERR